MGDTYIIIVPLYVSKEEVAPMKEKILSYLTTRKVIKELETDCTFDGQGYHPGENFAEVVKDKNGTLLRLNVNGLSIHS
jgi:hypothetical protein